MLRVVWEGANVTIKFYHKTLDAQEIINICGVLVDGPRRCTMAKISFDEKEANSGLSICNPIDNFRRSTGRKRSLADCLEGFDKNLRREMWKEYEVQFGF